MPSRRHLRYALMVLMAGGLVRPVRAAEPAEKGKTPIAVEELPEDPGLVKIVLVAGSSTFKPGEHEYVAGCAVLADLLRQTPGVFPVLAIDWPKKPETLTGAEAVVMLFDGGDKHALLKDDRLAAIRALADSGAGLVQLHQVADYPIADGDRARALFGAAWEKGYSQRAHWVARFQAFTDHPIFRGVAPFTIDDGWLSKLRFVPEGKGVSPLLRSVSPKAPPLADPGDTSIVSWAYDRPEGSRSFTFTGGHLHKSLADEAYRRFLVNGILWAAKVEIPSSGAPVALSADELGKYLPQPPVEAKK